jgi:DNA-binding LacI/PurR family transcriptional regulator
MTRNSDRPAVMYDVARLAQVSHQTVSRVLNNQPNVRPETRQRVEAAIRALNYRPNAMARGLVTRRARRIGVISFSSLLFGPAATLSGIEHAARDAGYAITVATLDHSHASEIASVLDVLADQSVDGVIAIAPQVWAAHALLGLGGVVPLVAVEAGLPDRMPVASVDQFVGAQLATDHLLQLGHRRIWHVAGPEDFLESAERIEGWRASLSLAGVAAPEFFRGDWSPRSGYAAGLELAARRAREEVTAVFVANDQMAVGVIHALHEQGLRVPEDISVVGFDDIPEAEFTIPALTTIRQDFDEVGRRGMALLVSLLDSVEVAPSARQRVKPTLIVRASTTRPAN